MAFIAALSKRAAISGNAFGTFHRGDGVLMCRLNILNLVERLFLMSSEAVKQMLGEHFGLVGNISSSKVAIGRCSLRFRYAMWLRTVKLATASADSRPIHIASGSSSAEYLLLAILGGILERWNGVFCTHRLQLLTYSVDAAGVLLILDAFGVASD